MIKRYLQICDNDIKYIIVGLFCGCIGSYYGVFVSEHMSRIMQGDFSNERLKMLFRASIITVITTSMRGACFTYSQKCTNHRLSCIIFKKLLYQSNVYYQITPVSTLLERATNDVRIVSEIISLNINVLSRSIISLVITFWLLINISYKLTIIAGIMIVVNFYISKIYDKLHQYIMKGFEDNNKLLNNFIHETISHISIVKTYATEEYSYKKQNNMSNNISKYYYKESILYAFNAFIFFNMPVITTISVIVSANYMNIREGLITFILHNQTVYSTIKQIMDFKNEFIRCKEPYKRIIELLDTDIDIHGYYIPYNDKTDIIKTNDKNNHLKGDILFKDVNFKYHNADNNVLTDFNFNIKQGDKIAIVGSSGCGKSTIAKLLIGILSPISGNIYIDNIDITTYDNKWLKSKIGYVAQESVLFADTIENNIAYGIDWFNEDDVISASKLANAHEFITKLPNGYKTKLQGTELSSLSGGQKQRISIARALIRRPQIIIFDEATSALDPYCEEIVQNTIKECFKIQHSTMIIIAHRRSALKIADKIYTLNNSEMSLTNL
jgi:ABC-type multidrug transport system fused ATPase/permease subunit